MESSSTESTINTNLENFKNRILKSGLSQIGGKGTVRRKKKNTNFKLNKKKIKTQTEMNLENIIRRVNNLLYEINDTEDFEMFDVWFQDHILFYFDSLKKYEIISKELLNLIKQDSVEFFFSHLVINENTSNTLELIFDTETLSKYFNQDGIEFISGFYQDIENILLNKKYIEEKKEEDSNKFSTKECYKILGFDITDDITLKELKLKYRRLAMELHPDKHPNEQELYHDKFQELSKAYKQLLSNFNEK